jgi:hypothetical protein
LAVAGYALFEASLLLVYLLPGEAGYPSRQEPIIILAQFLTIPGMAVLFSMTLYGRYQWKRRVAIHFVTVPGLFMMILLMGFPAALIHWAYNKYNIDPITSFLFSIANLLYPVVVLVMASVIIFYIIKRARKRAVELESSRWLAERHSEIGARERRKRERGIRWSLWIPSLVVLTVFLFLPEVWGVLTHIQQPEAGQLPGYEITIPPTWVILYHGADSQTGAAIVDGMAVRGMGLDVRRYLHFGDLPLSSWDVGIAEFGTVQEARVQSNSGERITQHDFQVGKGTLICFESNCARARWLHSSTEPLADVECSGPNRLRARFIGERVHLPSFYEMLSKMTLALPR